MWFYELALEVVKFYAVETTIVESKRCFLTLSASSWEVPFTFQQYYFWKDRLPNSVKYIIPSSEMTSSDSVPGAYARYLMLIERCSWLTSLTSIAGDRCRLNGKDLVRHVITILRSQDKIFVAHYQNILLKYVLTSRVYCCEITSSMWQG